MRKLLVILWLFFLLNSSYAIDMQSVANQTISEANNLKAKSYAQMSQFNPGTVFDHYSAHPPQSQYYSGTNQADTNQMNQDAVNSLSSSDAGKVVMNSINQHPHYTITNNTADMKHSLFIQSEADHIVQGVTSQYTDCKPKQACHVQYTTQICSESSLSQNAVCRKNRIVSAHLPDNAIQTITIKMQALPRFWFKHTAIVTVDLLDKKVIETDGKVLSLSISPEFQSVPCDGLQISLLSAESDDPKYPVKVDMIDLPHCSQHFKFRMRLTSGRWFASRSMNVVVKYRFAAKLSPLVQDSWSNDCYYFEALSSQGVCQLKKPDTCVSNGSTRQINGIPISRDCWAMQSTYACNGGDAQNNCGVLQNQGCEQTGSVCQKKINDRCMTYQQTYRCPINACTNTTELVCGNGKDYCLDGNCVSHDYKPSQDFAKGMSALSALQDASLSFDQNANVVFKGHAEECRDDAGNFSDCCRQTGWGQDWNLAHCSNEEKALGPNREHGLTVYVGRYCSDYFPWPFDHACKEHKETYCVFNSKLARIIQQQGREGQLHRAFGNAEHPDCNGITPAELQHINLSHIDFHDFYADLDHKTKTPDLNQVKQMIEQHINQYSQSGQSNE